MLFNSIFWQIHEEAKKFGYRSGVKIVVAYGGAPISQQVCVDFKLFSALKFVSICYHCKKYDVFIHFLATDIKLAYSIRASVHLMKEIS